LMSGGCWLVGLVVRMNGLEVVVVEGG
jgi:hypothetical protein